MIFIEFKGECLRFAQEAAEYFSQNPEQSTYTAEDEIQSGEYFAFRWNTNGGICVILIGDETPVVYTDL